jgi:hypothetical protein
MIINGLEFSGGTGKRLEPPEMVAPFFYSRSEQIDVASYFTPAPTHTGLLRAFSDLRLVN